MRRNKYRAKRTFADGISFASKREANVYSKLCALERSGLIFDLKLQVPFKLVVNGILTCTYVADFTYRDKGDNNKLVVADAKGFKTPVYKIKRNLMKAVHGVDILEL